MDCAISACCDVGAPLAKRLEWLMSAFISLMCLAIGITGLAGGFRLVNPCFYTSLITLALGTWVQIPSAAEGGAGQTRSQPRLMAMWGMAAAVSITGLIIGIAGLAGAFTVVDNCFYPGLITLVIGTWVKVPSPSKRVMDGHGAGRSGGGEGDEGAEGHRRATPVGGDGDGDESIIA